MVANRPRNGFPGGDDVKGRFWLPRVGGGKGALCGGGKLRQWHPPTPALRQLALDVVAGARGGR
jgi:hypothetical protein